MKLHIFICSNLNIGAGGCEIWLEYFVKYILKSKKFKYIYIYYVDEIRSNVINFDSRKVILVKNKVSSISGILTVLYFSIGSFFKFLKYFKQGDKCILVGSTYTAFIGLLILIYKFLTGKNLQLMTWIRSIAIGELSVRSPWLAIMMKKIEYWLLKKSQLVICNGLDTYNYYKNSCGLTNIEFINNALNYEKLFTLNNKILKNKTINIAFLGRYCYAKGFDKYLESVELFFKQNSIYKEDNLQKVIFHAFGYGELEDKINSKFIVNHGKYEPKDLINILDNVEIVVFLNESGKAGGVSHSLLEAMASARLIVAWDNFIHKQIIDDNAAIFIKENNILGLVNFYKKLLYSDKAYLNKLYIKTCQAKELAKQYTPENHVEEFLRLVKKYEYSNDNS